MKGLVGKQKGGQYEDCYKLMCTLECKSLLTVAVFPMAVGSHREVK